MPTCPSGAKPKPGLTAATALLSLGLLGTDVIDHIALIWPGLVAQTVWGRVDVATLCADNPDDPGPPTAEDLAYTAILAAQAAGGSLGGAYGSWALKQIYYQVFRNSCDCISATETIPPPAPVPPPTGEPPFPTDPKSQDPFTQIIVNQQASTEGLYLLYQGIQASVQQSADARGWSAPNRVRPEGVYTITMSGEGEFTIPATYPSGDPLREFVGGIEVAVETLPNVYKVRGTLNPRYYGIGSIYWKSEAGWFQQPLIYGRESIHYLNQSMATPRTYLPSAIAWHLQPGASANARILLRNQPPASLFYDNAYDGAWNTFYTNTPPDGFQDPPLVPGGSRTFYSLPGGGLPP